LSAYLREQSIVMSMTVISLSVSQEN